MHEQNQTARSHESRQKTVRALSLLFSVLCIVAVFIGSGLRRQKAGFPLGDLSGVQLAQAKAEYEESGDVHKLIAYLKALCYQAEVAGEASAEDEIRRCGTQLLDLARAEVIDLEELGDEDETLLDLLKLIRAHGAK